MKKQFLSVLTMLSLAVALIVAATAAPAAARGFETITVDVPFDFTSGSTVFPAGKYTIKPITESGTVVWIRSENGKAFGMLMCSSAHVLSPKDETSLVFKRYADHYFLSQIWTVGETTGIELPKSSMERRFQQATQERKGPSAGASEPAIVTVAAGSVRAQ
jgi:hypothetical protein